MTRTFVVGGRIAVIASAVALAGCGTTTGGKGAVAGLGSTATRMSSTTYIAALQGGVIGRLADLDIGSSDRQRALEAEYRALEAAPGGQPVTWEQDGEQYVSIISGWGGAVPLWGGEVAKKVNYLNQGGMVWTFRLPKQLASLN